MTIQRTRPTHSDDGRDLEADGAQPGPSLRILHVGVGNLGPGGVATYVRHVSAEQRRIGHQVMVAEFWPSKDVAPEVEVFLPGIPDLVRIQEQWRPDVVHLHSLIPDWSALRGAAVVTAHEHSVHCPSGARFLYGKSRACERNVSIFGCLAGHYLDRCGSRRPSSVLSRMKISFASMAFRGTWIAPSRYTHSEMIRRGIPESRVEILHNPATFATLARSSTSESRSRIVYVGRLARNKGVDLLISAMANLPDSVELFVVGAGPEADSLSEMARRVPYSQRIHLIGWKEPAEVRAIMSEAACLVVPSLWPEPFGLVVLEAFSLGCPVVAADTGGLRDLVIPGRTGYLFPPGSATGLAEQIRLCLHQPEIAEAMAISGQQMAEREFRLDMHVNRLGLIYRRQGART